MRSLLVGSALWIGLASVCAWTPLADAQEAATVTADRKPAARSSARAHAGRAAPRRGPNAPEAHRPAPPADLSDLGSWLRYRALTRQAALPLEARVFYRRGLLAREGGGFDEAVRLLRGAAELDPTFDAPHLTLFSWFLLRDPGQALLQSAALVELAKQNFVFQLELAANVTYLLIHALFTGLLAVGFVLLLVRHQELRHPIAERLTRFLNPRASRKWPWVFLALPYVAGLGMALPTVFYLGLLWPTSRARERTLFVALTTLMLTVPWLTAQMDRFASPLRQDEAPFYGVLTLQNEPYSEARRAEVAALAERRPDQSLPRFGLAWLSRQGGDLTASEASYQEALQLWPDNDRVMNNLANTVALQGRQDEALELYQKAIQANSQNAAAYFNLSQIYTQRYDYHHANEALSHASALNFEMVKASQAQTTVDGMLPLVDQWVSPRALWETLLAYRSDRPPTLPAVWRDRIEFASGPFAVAMVIVAIAGVLIGVLQSRAMPLRRCSNCERVVCRRCAERRRELALCRSCAAVEARAKAADFARMLLTEHRRKSQRPVRIARTVLAALIPGFGMLAFRRVFTPVILLAASALLVGLWNGAALPFAFEPRLVPLEHKLHVVAALAPWVLVYAWSIIGFFGEQARQDARAALALKTGRSRVSASRHFHAAAA